MLIVIICATSAPKCQIYRATLAPIFGACPGKKEIFFAAHFTPKNFLAIFLGDFEIGLEKIRPQNFVALEICWL